MGVNGSTLQVSGGGVPELQRRAWVRHRGHGGRRNRDVNSGMFDESMMAGFGRMPQPGVDPHAMRRMRNTFKAAESDGRDAAEDAAGEGRDPVAAYLAELRRQGVPYRGQGEFGGGGGFGGGTAGGGFPGSGGVQGGGFSGGASPFGRGFY